MLISRVSDLLDMGSRALMVHLAKQGIFPVDTGEKIICQKVYRVEEIMPMVTLEAG